MRAPRPPRRRRRRGRPRARAAPARCRPRRSGPCRTGKTTSGSSNSSTVAPSGSHALVAADLDRRHLVAPRAQRRRDALGRGERDLVLARAAAHQHDDAGQGVVVVVVSAVVVVVRGGRRRRGGGRRRRDELADADRHGRPLLRLAIGRRILGRARSRPGSGRSRLRHDRDREAACLQRSSRRRSAGCRVTSGTAEVPGPRDRHGHRRSLRDARADRGSS